MHGLKVWLSAVVIGLCAGQAHAQGYFVPTGTVGYPVVVGPVYTPVPVGVRYAPAYRYVTPTAYSYNVQTITPVAATEIVPTPAVSTTSTVVSAPVATGYVTQTSYYTPTMVTPIMAPTVVTPLVPVVRPYARVSVFPRRGVMRIRY